MIIKKSSPSAPAGRLAGGAERTFCTSELIPEKIILFNLFLAVASFATFLLTITPKREWGKLFGKILIKKNGALMILPPLFKTDWIGMRNFLANNYLAVSFRLLAISG